MSDSMTTNDSIHTNHNGKYGRRRTREERGLPEDEALRKLARMYLQTQRRLWPELGRISPYAKAHDQDVEAMAEAFKAQFLSGKLGDHFIPRPKTATAGVGVSYLRYSCDNSNPRSLDDQLRLQLEKARTRGESIPWRYVFADASVTGTHRERSGYKLAKKAVRSDDEVKTLYIDEIGRASRDGIEALRLGKLVQGLGKQIIGVSDGFDSREQFSQMKLHMFAMMNEWFVEQLRHKVGRGMKGAVKRGTSIGKPALGHMLVPLLDTAGQPVRGKDGAPLNTYAINPDTRSFVELAFKLYGQDHWPGTKIAKHFNELQVDGRKSWTGSSIYQLLRRYLYVGIRVYNKQSKRNDPETGKITVIENDRRLWQVKRERHLQIIPWKLWKKVQKRLAEARAASPTTGNKFGARRRVFAKTLFDGTLVCGVCGRDLVLYRSTEKFKQVSCPNGAEAKNDCTLWGSKSVRIIEMALMGYLRDHLLNAEHVKLLVDKANRYLAEEAGKPRTDTSGLEKTLADLTVKRDRLAEAVENDGAADVPVIVERLKRVEAEIRDVKTKLQDIQRANAVPPKPLNVDDVLGLLTRIEEILNQEPAAAAPVLRELTGPIKVYQKRVPGRKKLVWIAMFGPNLVPLLARTAREHDCPDSLTWEYLSQRGWTMASPAGVVLGAVPAYIRYALEIARLVDEEDMNCAEVARALDIGPLTARQAYKFAKHGLKVE